MRHFVLLLLSAHPAISASLDISSGSALSAALSAGNAKFRLSQANFDQSLGYGSGTNTGTFRANDLGSNPYLGQSAYLLDLTYGPESGFTFTMTRVEDPARATSLSWSAAAPIGGVSPSSFNAIEIDARANLVGSSLSYSGISFTGIERQRGSFASGTVSAGVASTQWIVADTDLSRISWTLRATVSAQRTAIASGDENVRFVMTMRQVDLPVSSGLDAPEASTWVMLTLGMLLVAMSVIRQRKSGLKNRRPETMR